MVMAPLEPEEMLERCDLAGEASVLEVLQNPAGPGVIARLKFTRIVKGSVRRSPNERRNIAVVKLRGSALGRNGEPLLGEWSDYYHAGTFVFTHLDWDERTGFYSTSWWNALRTVRAPTPSGWWLSLKRRLGLAA